jgi:Zn-finger nucleic acid-binding protein
MSISEPVIEIEVSCDNCPKTKKILIDADELFHSSISDVLYGHSQLKDWEHESIEVWECPKCKGGML